MQGMSARHVDPTLISALGRFQAEAAKLAALRQLIEKVK